MTKAAWFMLAAAVLLVVVAVIMGCRQPLQPIEVNVLPPDDGVDTVRVEQILGIWKNKIDDYQASWGSPFQELWKQIEFRVDKQYVFSIWDTSAHGQFSAGKQVYAEMGTWQLSPPNRLYLTTVSATERQTIDTSGSFLLKVDGDYLWIGNTLYQRGKW